jgi:demethylmacrocin O-methyltransferase
MEIIQNIRETPLCKLAFKYGTDKCPTLRHSSTPFYYELFRDRRRRVKKLLEIGIGFKRKNPTKQYELYQVGASLMMWRDFFPNAEIYGIDVVPDSLIKGERIHTSLCDQSNKEQLENLIKEIGGDIDIVIDDGSHLHQHQVISARVLMPLLQKDVDYLIEDVQYNETVTRRLSSYNCMVVSFPFGTYRNRKNNIHNDRIVYLKNK